MNLTSEPEETGASGPAPKTMPVRVIRPVSGADSLRDILRSLNLDFATARELAWRLFVRDTRAAHRQSLLGLAWLFLPPIATTCIWIFLNSQQIVSIDTGTVPYPVFVLTGTVLWSAFNGALVGTIGVIGEARSMVSKLNFPHESLLLAAFYKTLLNVGVQSLLLIPALLFLSHPSGWGILFLPIGLLSLALLGTSLGVILIPIGTLYTDVGRGVQLILRFAFFVTPVVYPIPNTEFGRFLAVANPVAPLLVTTRGLLIGGESPSWLMASLISIGSIVLLIAGVMIYKLALPRLVERLSS